MRSSAPITSPASSSPSRQSTASRRLVKLSRASTIPGMLLQPAFDLADAAGAADAFDGEIHMRQAAVARCTNIERSSGSGHGAPQRKNDAVAASGTCEFAVARQLDHQVPLPDRCGRCVRGNVPAHASSQRHECWSARLSVGCTSRAAGLQGRRAAGRGVARDDLDQRRAAPRRTTFAFTCQCSASCACDRGGFAREGEPGLIGAFGLDAAEGR